MGIGFSKPEEQQVAKGLAVGDAAPALSDAQSPHKKVVAFLRHSGCPFAEATVKSMRSWAVLYPDIDFIAVTHGDSLITENWLAKIGGHTGLIHIHDSDRVLHGQWGIGFSERQHFTGLATLAAVFMLLFQGIRNREDTGTRWQRSATFFIDANNKVIWRHVANSAHELPPIKNVIDAA
jgi:hypothetical protein